MHTWPVRGVAVALLATVVACQTAPNEPSPVTWSETAPAHFTPAQADQHARAIAARDALFQELMARLQTALAEGGPEQAIGVCKVAAPAIAQDVSATQDVAIGRTSFALRNPRNIPPGWAETWVAERAAEPRFATSADGHLAALLPIRLQEACTVCHGPADAIPGAVKARLAALYPDDQATGFQPGDLRGWFWIDVPPDSRPASNP